MTDILPVYEQTKQFMDFDPDVQVQLPEIPALRGGFWSELHDKYPMSLRERIRQEQLSMGWTDEQLEQEWAWMNWLFEQERSKSDANESAQQEATAPGHTDPDPGGGAAQVAALNAGEAGTRREDSGDQGGEVEQVPSPGDPQADPGGEHEGGGGEAAADHVQDG